MANVDVDITNIGVALFNRYFLQVAATALGVGRNQLDYYYRHEKYNKLTLDDIEKVICGINVPKMTLNEFYALLGIKQAFDEKIYREVKKRGLDAKLLCELNAIITLNNFKSESGKFRVATTRVCGGPEIERTFDPINEKNLEAGIEKIANTKYEDNAEKGVDMFLYLIDQYPFFEMNNTTCLVASEFFMIKHCSCLIVIKPEDFEKIEKLLGDFRKFGKQEKLKDFLLQECICRFEPSSKFYEVLDGIKNNDGKFCGYAFSIGGSCPEQGVGFIDNQENGDEIGYFRFRHDELTFDYPNCSLGKEIYRYTFTGFRNRGELDSDEERAIYLVEIIDQIDKHRNKGDVRDWSEAEQWNYLKDIVWGQKSINELKDEFAICREIGEKLNKYEEGPAADFCAWAYVFGFRKIITMLGLPTIQYLIKNARKNYVMAKIGYNASIRGNYSESGELDLDKDDFIYDFPQGSRRDEYRKFRKIILENPKLGEAEILKLFEKEGVK